VTGLCARGGFEVDVKWAGGTLERAVIRSRLGGPCKVRAGERLIDLQTQAGKEYVLDGQLAVANAGGK
jgi:alpha-L-fucosidase 2